MKWILKHLVAAMVVVIALVVGAIIFLNVVTKHGQELVVPDLSNLTIEQADSVASDHEMVIFSCFVSVCDHLSQQAW